MTTLLEEGDWLFGVLLETCRDRSRSISRPRVRPVEELPRDIRVEFPRSLREMHPIGTRFRADVKVCQKHWRDGSENGPPYLRADTDTIVKVDDYTPNKIIFAVERAGTISGRAYDYIETPATDISSFDEIRRIAYASATLQVHTEKRERWERERKELIGSYALVRSRGNCEACEKPAPFLRHNDTPYLEIHHIDALASGGTDHPMNVAALCPNCHRGQVRQRMPSSSILRLKET